MRTSSPWLLLAPTLLLAPVLLPVPAAAQSPTPCPTAPVTDHGKPLAVNGNKLASPAEDTSTALNGSTLTLHYNAPSIRCRTIFGGLVPYGKVWRTGADPATAFHTPIALKIGSLSVPAGDYTIYSLPEEGKPWLLILNKQTGQWGTVYTPEMDLGRVQMKGSPQRDAQEVMTLSFEHTTRTTTQLHIRWAHADEFVRISAE